jgi:NAD(P)-dependent dehydrogenase (short-subunit alcohol dehydrogenase family)
MSVRHDDGRSARVFGPRRFTTAQGLIGKIALATGVSRSIGRAIVQGLAQDVAAVVVNYAASAKQAQETVGLIEKAGGKAAAVQADVSKVADVKRLFDTCLEKFGRLDILVNNAGVMFTKPVVEVGEEEFDLLFAVNVKGAFFCCQEAAKRMADGGKVDLVIATGVSDHSFDKPRAVAEAFRTLRLGRRPPTDRD